MIKKGWVKPCVVLLFFMVVAVLHFWLSSRYPGLNAKATLSTTAPLSALGFDPVVEIKGSFSITEKIFWNTVNWVNTNRKGMTFSFVFGAFFLALMPCLNLRQSLSGFKSALLGLGVGAPLGVCVNCAAPIARAMQASGYALQTALAALIASPSLNIVVIMMAFSMFPFHMVATRLILVFVLILVLIPLACHLFFGREVDLQKSGETLCKTTSPDKNANIVFAAGVKGWVQASFWALKAYIVAFLTLLAIALPLMILAGFLGSVAVTLLPWDMFKALDWQFTAGAAALFMTVLALFGTLLPSPIAFDVVLSSVLLQVGVPMPYVAVFFFTLGTFSIYAFFIVWQAVSFRVASFLFVATAALGILAGMSAMIFENYLIGKAQQNVIAAAKQAVEEHDKHVDSGEFDPVIDREQADVLDFAALSSAIELQKFNFLLMPQEALKSGPEDITIMQHEFVPEFAQDQKNGQARFSRIYGEEAGIVQPYLVSFTSFVPDDLVYSTMSIAAGDVHNDGWPDLLVMGDHEVQPNIMLYSNMKGQGYKAQALPVTRDMGMIVLVYLVDLNADGWLDIVFTTYSGVNYVIYNDKGDFKHKNMKLLRDKKGITMSLGFADIDHDGDLDIFEGNWGYGPLNINRKNAQNYVLKATDGGYEEVPLEGLTGETLSSIIADINSDGHPDIYVGNDYIMAQRSDQIYLGDGQGNFTLHGDKAHEIGVMGTQSTMSLDFSDIDNDALPELYIGQIAFSGQYMHSMSKIAEKQIPFAKFCEVQGMYGKDKQACLSDMKFRESLIRASHFNTDACDGLSDPLQVKKCLAHMLHFKKDCFYMNFGEDEGDAVLQKNLIGVVSGRYTEICARDEDPEDNEDYSLERNIEVSNASLHNVLLRKENASDIYTEQGNERGIGYGGWTWNARFADLDMDGWKDLYIANGYYFPLTLASNLFYRNQGDGSFEDKTRDFGLEDYSFSSAYVYVDYDRDGDLDIVTVPMDGDVIIYRNENRDSNKSIAFMLEDKRSKNTHGLGAKVLIFYEMDGKTLQQRVDIQGSGGYKSINAPEAYFGLGKVNNIQSVSVEWPDGGQSAIEGDFVAGKIYKIIRE